MGKDIDRHHNAVSSKFNKELQRFHIQAGRPTLKQIELLSNELPGIRHLSRSTVNDILNGKRTGIPDWEWLRSFVTVCRVHAERAHARLDHLATEAEWYQHWYVTNLSSIETAPLPILCPDGDRPAVRAAMVELARRGRMMSWLRDFPEVVPEWREPYLSLESAASQIRAYEPADVPELLQTEAYARAAIGLGHPGAGAAEIDRRVELRLRRQRMLREREAVLWAIFDEGVLDRPGIPAGVLRAQAEALVAACERRDVTLQIMPVDDATGGGPIAILRFPVSELADVVYLDQGTIGLYPNTQRDVLHYSQVFGRLGIIAKKRAETISILKRIVADR